MQYETIQSVLGRKVRASSAMIKGLDFLPLLCRRNKISRKESEQSIDMR